MAAFTDITAAAGAGGGGNAVAVVPTDFDNRRDIDLLIVNDGTAPVLLQNLRDGTFRDAATGAGLPPAGRYTTAAAGDLNKDGATDFFFGTSDGAGVFAMSNGSGSFVGPCGPRTHRAVRWRRSSSTTTTMACSICSCCRTGRRTCSATWEPAGPTSLQRPRSRHLQRMASHFSHWPSGMWTETGTPMRSSG